MRNYPRIIMNSIHNAKFLWRTARNNGGYVNANNNHLDFQAASAYMLQAFAVFLVHEVTL